MDWSSFWGGLSGTVIAFVSLVGVILLWDAIERRRTKNENKPLPKIPTLDDIFEKQLEQHILDHFTDLFPGWKIVGTQYKTKAGPIDILSTDEAGNFVVIELKRDKAPDTVVAQTDRYMAWVENNLVQPGQKVRGIIIARKYDHRLVHTLQRRPDMEGWLYTWQLVLGKTMLSESLIEGGQEEKEYNLVESMGDTL